MNDFISRQALIAEFKEKCNGECGCCEYNDSGFDTGEKCRLIHEAPAADVQPVKAGEWLEDEYAYFRCSECGYEQDQPETVTPYCPGCGVHMEDE